MEFVSIESLVPADHLLRAVEKTISFSFIRDRVAHLYCADNGRPAIDPVLLFKLLFIGYLFGIRSERALVREVQVNVAYRWFLGLNFCDAICDHSTLSQNRRRRFSGTSIHQDIFDEIVEQAMARGLVDGTTLFTDSTHLKANANNKKHVKKVVAQTTRRYLAELEQAVTADRAAHGLPPLPPPKQDKEPPTKQVRQSRTDPESGYMARESKPRGFAWLDHRTVDGKYAIITDSHVTPGNEADSTPLLERLQRQRQRFGFAVAELALDAGYWTPENCRGLEKAEVYAVISPKRSPRRKGIMAKKEFVYDEQHDCYLCPCDQVLRYRTTSREGNREYVSDARVCAACPRLGDCTKSKKGERIITRHVWEEYKEAIAEHGHEERGIKLYGKRKQTVERSFADAKQLHGQRYARMRGLERVREQCLLAAACQNMKKMALVLGGELRAIGGRVWRFMSQNRPETTPLAFDLAA